MGFPRLTWVSSPNLRRERSKMRSDRCVVVAGAVGLTGSPQPYQADEVPRELPAHS